MELSFFKPSESLGVGSYYPSESWAKFTQFAVMGHNSQMLIATTGYFQPVNTDDIEPWGLDEYGEAACCIEQAQLYANAHLMFNLLSRVATSKEFECSTIQGEVKALLEQITNIEEPVKRLLGKDAMIIVNHVKGKY